MERITARHGARLTLLQSKPSRSRDEVYQMFEVTIGERAKRTMLEDIRRDSEVVDLEITSSGNGRLAGVVRARGAISRCIADSDCFLLSASNESGPTIAWKVLGTAKSVKGLLTRLDRRGIKYRIRDLSEVSNRGRVTARQEWLLRQAFDRGYFDDPKRIHIRGLAESLGISYPALHEALRGAQRKVLSEHLRRSQVAWP